MISIGGKMGRGIQSFIKKGELIELYINQKLSIHECERLLKVGRGVVGPRLDKWNISRRKIKGRKKGFELSQESKRVIGEKNSKYDIDKTVLYDLYHTQKLSQRIIGTKYNCSQSVINRLMKKYNIKIRTRKERDKLKGEKLKENTHCIGRIPWNKDKPWDEVTKKKMSITKLNDPETMERCRTMNKGRKHTDEEKKNLRFKSIQNIQKQLKENGQMFPFYNSTACEYFKWIDDNIFESEGQYATNGGEYHIKELGYWLDYINTDLKVIIEWDEEKHYKNDKLNIKDKTRQKEIESVFPDYDFIRIRESQLNYFMLCLLVAMRYKNDKIRKA